MLFLNLKNFWHYIKRDYFLLLIIFFGLFLRGINPTFGSPSLYVSNDEAIAHLSALNMIAAKTPISIANYTPFGAYLQIPFIVFSYIEMKTFSIVRNAEEFELFLLTHEGYFLFIPRLISALFGALTILVVYKISLDLFSAKKIALLSAFLAAASFNLVHISNMGRPWSAALFFMLLSVHFALKRNSFASLFSCLVGFGFHQVAILLLPLIIALLRVRKRYLFLQFILFFFGILVLNSLTLKIGLIQAISNNQSFLLKDRLITDILVGNFNFPQSIYTTITKNLGIYYLKNLIITDFVPFFLGLLGLFLSYRRSYQIKMLALYVLFYFIFASLFFHPLIRYLLPIFILMIPFAGYALLTIVKNKYSIFFLLIISCVNSFYWSGLYAKEPTFVLAHHWLKDNIESSVPIAYTGGRFSNFVPDKNAVSYLQLQEPGAWKTLSKHGDYFGENVRNIVYLNKFRGHTKLEQFKTASLNYHFAYVVDYYLDLNDSLLQQDQKHFVLVKKFNPTLSQSNEGIAEVLFDASSNFDTYEKRKSGSMYRLQRAGPYFDILKVIY